MQVYSFMAASAGEALAQIRQQLGPTAVVLHVRPVPGLARLWSKSRIEVFAAAQDPASTAPAADALAGVRTELAELKQQLQSWLEPAGAQAAPPTAEAAGTSVYDGWRIAGLLESDGLLPAHARRVAQQLSQIHGPAPAAPEAQIDLAREFLRQAWPASSRAAEPRSDTRLLIGPSGAGKTTCLCKWLTKAVLVENRMASVWRLDGRVANTAECLSIYCEILDVPVQRSWPTPVGRALRPAGMLPNEELRFIDLPGVNWRSTEDLAGLEQQLAQFPGAEVHLVLNAAYDAPVLLEQARAFSQLPLSGLIMTHLDEELRWGKLWNLIFGINCSMNFLSAGQNIPADFEPASAEKLLSRQFRRV